MDDIDANRPPESTQADVTLITRGITVTARVDLSTEHVIVVRPGGEVNAWKTAVKTGETVEVFWVGSTEERTLPARIVEIDAGEDPHWHLAPTGPATRSQRRKAVRARLEAPVALPWAGSQLTGTTLDLSEAGMRALVDGWGLPPEEGARLQVTIDLGSSSVELHGEVAWLAPRGPRWLLAMRFYDVPERDADRLRIRVFAALRAERAAAMR